MPLPDTNASRGPEELLSDILTYIDEAEALVTARDVAPLAGLDSVVEVLCTRILMLDGDASREYKPELEHLMARLDLLQQKMMALKDEVATTLKSVDVQRKANKAYISAPSTTTTEA
jgi:hypothetical protein